MGFKDFVARNSHEDVYQKMLKLSNYKIKINNWLSEVTDGRYAGKDLYTTSYSDSIIIFSKDDSIASFELITHAVIYLFSNAMTDLVPMKGAIAYGKISVNKEEQIFFGQSLIDAFLLQEDVNYYGVVAHHSVDNYINDNFSVISNYYKKYMYREVKTSLKSGSILHNNINWVLGLDEGEYIDEDSKAPIQGGFSIEEELIFKIEEIMRNLKFTASGSPRKYIDNSIDVFNKMLSKE